MDNTLDPDGYIHLHTHISYIYLYNPLMGESTYAAATILGSTAVSIWLGAKNCTSMYGNVVKGRLCTI